ncbi:hypothetical protein RN001_007870 [Aquatica leii]|uniref:HP domain-containing protein n=1 Tax=Aquatica leii TaxID=1421715 RepID=A0AAN7PWY6_9COLE|nr:hypothetical protein RN001_007870 [Aquatica leii]
MQIIELQSLDYDEVYTNGHSSIDAAFRNIHKNVSTFLIWKIERMQLVLLPKDQYGIFYNGDAYVIYASSLYGNPAGIETVTREIRNGSLEYHIHFWLGSSTIPDKSGVAAYKTVELDEHLGGVATQHREVQGNESARFKSYFKNGYRVLKANIESPLTEFEPKLFKVKGKKVPIIIQEDHVSWNFFSSGDVMLIVTHNILFVWIGRASNTGERLHASKIAISLKDEYNISTITFVDDGYEKTIDANSKKELNKYLPLEKRLVLPSDSNDDLGNEHESKLRLYKCTEISGKYRVVEVKVGPLSQTDLNNNDVFIVDNGNDVWVWVGKKVKEKERSEALRNARGFVKKKNYPNNTRVTRIVDEEEPVDFKMLFSNWKDKNEAKTGLKSVSLAKVAGSKFDAEILHERPSLAAECQLIDDGSGDIKIFKISKTNLIEIPKIQYGTFFSEECYLILYSYEVKTLNSVVYTWLGNDASQDDKKVALLKATELTGELKESVMQVRIVQGFEPPHFLQLFLGKMIVFTGKGNELNDEQGKKSKTNFLLQIHGSNTYTAKGMQVYHKAANLNSNYCYVLKKRKHYYIWCGGYTTGDQRESAKGFVGKDFVILMEGKESQNFWDDLGGKTTYNSSKLVNYCNNHRIPRLFQCNSTNGLLKVEEIVNFSQSDLMPEDVMLLDSRNAVIMWLGRLSSRNERVVAINTAEEYLKNDSSGRNVHTPVTVVEQGYEPPIFTGFFVSWDDGFWISYKSFDQIRNEIEGKNTTEIIKEKCGSHKSNHFDQYVKYPVSILTATNDKLPNKIDPLQKEVHLTHDDFVTLFKINYSEFETLPKWKQQEMKKKVGLF